MICDECKQEREEKDLRYNAKWKNNICRYCFIDELIYNAEKNKAKAAVMASQPAALGWAQKGASELFDRMMPKAKKKAD